MDLNTDELIKFLDNQPQYKNELAVYYESMKKLPSYDYSNFYSVYPEYADIITQGDAIGNLKIISLPDTEISNARAMIFSNTCDIDLANQRKFPTRLIYAPIIKLSAYKDMLEEANEDDVKIFTKEQVNGHIADIRAQGISQIFYLPESKNLEEESIVFFDRINSADNESISREALSTERIFSLSSYGWYVFLARLSHFFNKLSDETVQLRFKPGIPSQ